MCRHQEPPNGPCSTIVANADRTDDPLVAAMAALLERDPACLTRAQALAVTSRDRQVVAISLAHLSGERDLVDALARDHLVSYPDSLIVSWIASTPSEWHVPPEPP